MKELPPAALSAYDGMKKALKHICSKAFLSLYDLFIIFLQA